MSSSIKKQGISTNFLFQFLYQFIILVIPLIVSPYLTRILGSTALGEYAFVNSIAYYFVLFANLGIVKHGQREIANNLENEIELRKSFWSLFFIHCITSIISIICYILFVFVFHNVDKCIYLIQSIYVASALFDITWLFYGLENFKSVVIKNILIKIIETILIFCLVKNTSDIYLYVIIVSSGFFLGQAVMIPQAIHLVRPISFNKSDVIKHIRPLVLFSITVIAVSLYTVFDKTLLGIITTKENVAFYEYGNKIVSIPKTIIVIVSTVMFPRACALASKGDLDGQKKYFSISIKAAGFFGFGSLFGLLAVSKKFAIIYYGNSFVLTGDVMMAMCALPLIIGLGDIVRTQYLIPNHKDKEYTICILINALINLAISIPLIPFLGIYGAVLGTTCAELFGLVYQLIICRKVINIRDLLNKLAPFLFFGCIMYCVLIFISSFTWNSIKGVLIDVAVGATVYSIPCLIYLLKTDILFRDIFKKTFKRKKRS